MPMIHLTMPVGVLSPAGRAELRSTLAATLLRWEGAPDTAVFRASTWCRIEEVAPASFGSLEDDLARFRVDVTVPAGALSQLQREGVITQLTIDVLNATGLGENDASRVWVLVHEQPEGTWGAGGGVLRLAEIQALAEQEQQLAEQEQQ